MNRNTPVIVLASLVGALAIYCSSAATQGGGGASGIGNANADSPSGSTCCDTAPQFTKLAEADLSVTAASGDSWTATQGPDVDVSSYRQVSVLPDPSGCSNVMVDTQFRADSTSTHWGTGLVAAGSLIPVLAPIMRVRLQASGNLCTATAHYVVLGVK